MEKKCLGISLTSFILITWLNHCALNLFSFSYDCMNVEISIEYCKQSPHGKAKCGSSQ